MAFLERWLGEKETIDENIEKAHNSGGHTPEQGGYVAFVKTLNEGLKRREASVKEALSKKKVRAAIAGLGMLWISGCASSAYGQDEWRELIRGAFGFGGQVVREVGSTARGGQRLEEQREREQTRRLADQQRIELQRLREETARLQADIRRQETELREKSRVQQEEVRKERDIGVAETHAAERTGTFIPRRGGSVETEETPTGARSTVKSDPESYYERTERERGAQQAQEDYRDFKRPSSFLKDHNASFQRAYKEEWRNLTGENLP